MIKRIVLLSILIAGIVTACGSIGGSLQDIEAEISADMPKEKSITTTKPIALPTKEPKIIPTKTELLPSLEPKRSEPTPLPSEKFQDLEWLPIMEAIENDLVDVIITGDGLEKIDIGIEPNIDVKVGVGFQPGLVFQTKSPGVQPMVLVEFREIILTPGVNLSLELEVNCADMELSAPSAANQFTISETTNSDLSRVAWAISEANRI